MNILQQNFTILRVELRDFFMIIQVIRDLLMWERPANTVTVMSLLLFLALYDCVSYLPALLCAAHAWLLYVLQRNPRMFALEEEREE